MPLIEELPVSGVSRISHGWAYVPDTAATIPAVQPSSRKRGRDGNTAASAASNAQAAHKLSAKQEKAIQQRLNDLGKENHREVHIPIPKRETAGAGAGTAARVKSTQNVRRILGYSRTFQHYLADEEAGVNVYGAAAVAAAAAVAGGGAGGAGAYASNTTALSSKNVDGRKRTDSKASTQKRTTTKSIKETKKMTTKTKGGRTRGRASTAAAAAVTAEDDEDVEMVDATTVSNVDVKKETTEPTQDATQQGEATETEQQEKYDPALDKDPLLKTRDVPKPPTDRVLQALLAEPMLSYNAARAKPLEGSDKSVFEIRTGSNFLVAKPQRWFCAVCGYWGKVRCRQGCGERVCGSLECWRGHEGVCALAGY